MYKLNVMTYGKLDPMNNTHEVSNEKLHIWQCRLNRFGIITSCKLIRQDCECVTDLQGLRSVFFNIHDMKAHVSILETLKEV